MNIVIPEGRGICPKCNGTKRRPAGNDSCKKFTYGYDAETDTFVCNNCGGQTMSGIAQGHVALRKDNGEPCLHKYTYTLLGNCYHGYKCEYCGHSYQIDSGG